MGTMNALYVRIRGDSTHAEIRKQFPTAKIEVGHDFIGAILANDAYEPPSDKLAVLSSDLNTDVIWLSFQSAVDAFQFCHWHSGTVLRSLVFGCYVEERTWERVEGVPEPWEREAFFDPKMLQYALEYAQTEGEKREFERIWKEGELLPGRMEPNIDARESARKVAEHFNFPGWN